MNFSSKKTYTRKNINQVFGVGLILFSLLCLLSAGTKSFWGLAAGISYLFGIEGLYLIVPFVMFAGIVLAITGSWEKPDITGRVGYGFTLFSLGVGMFWSHFGLGGTEKSSDFSVFRTAFQNYDANRVGYYTANDLGGGVIGYFFSAVFVKPGLWLLCLLAIFLILAGLIIIFLPFIKKFFRFLKTRAALSKSRRQTQRQKAQMERDYNPSPLPSSPASYSDRTLLDAPTNNPYGGVANPLQLSAPAPSPAVPPASAVPSRVDIYAAASIRNPLPQDLTTPESSAPRPSLPRAQLYSSGLQEAIFLPDGSSGVPSAATPSIPSSLNSIKDPYFSSPAPVQPKSAPAPVVPSPLPDPVFLNEVKLGEPIPVFENPEPSPVTSTAPELTEPVVPSKPRLLHADVVESPTEEPLEEPSQLIPEKETLLPSRVVPEVVAEPVAAKPEAPKPFNPINQPSAIARPKYVFPTIDLLMNVVDNGSGAEVRADCEKTKITVDHCLSDFRVGAHVESFTIGPSVTRYNIMCDPNVSVTTINRYIGDISQRLNGAPTRFQEVVRGQNTSGLEIPNKVTTRVSLREMVAALPTSDKDNLVIPFGKTISGECLSSDLAKFPHMLVAGSTGSGKSIFMHGVIMSLIMRNRPEDLKLILIDPKRVEMSNYEDIPHLLCPIIKEPVQAKICFDKLIKEMDRRYSLFEYSHVRDIRQFNHDYAPAHQLSPLPFIVVVVDEFADLVDTCKEISDSVVRIAQKARAAGIHLIISTQRPSVDVITGVIKANLACRVALRVQSAIDSQCILGQGGAEDLAGYGDMLIDCEVAYRGGFVRAQGAFVDTSELDSVCAFIKKQQAVVYDPNFLDLVDHEAEEANASSPDDPSSPRQEIKASDDEEYYQQLKAQIMTRQYTSISRIQRENGLGFPRAGRLFARLVTEGVVAPEPDTPGSSKGCRVLMHVDSNNSQPVAGSTDSYKNPNDGHLGEK